MLADTVIKPYDLGQGPWRTPEQWFSKCDPRINVLGMTTLGPHLTSTSSVTLGVGTLKSNLTSSPGDSDARSSAESVQVHAREAICIHSEWSQVLPPQTVPFKTLILTWLLKNKNNSEHGTLPALSCLGDSNGKAWNLNILTSALERRAPGPGAW